MGSLLIITGLIHVSRGDILAAALNFVDFSNTYLVTPGQRIAFLCCRSSHPNCEDKLHKSRMKVNIGLKLVSSLCALEARLWVSSLCALEARLWQWDWLLAAGVPKCPRSYLLVLLLVFSILEHAVTAMSTLWTFMSPSPVHG